jgi:diguanylate cyclase (GGDEF)-like protein
MKLFSRPRRPDGVDADVLRRSTRPERRYTSSMNNDEVREHAERLRELGVLSLFLHSAGTPEEMLALFLERAPRATGAIVTYPLLLDRRREVLTAQRLASIEDHGLEQACLAAEENLADLDFPLPFRSWRREVLESGEAAVTNDLYDVFEEVLTRDQCDSIKQTLEISRIAVVPLVMEGEAFGLCVFMFSRIEPDIEVLELAAGHCTLALKDLMAGEESTRFGGIDPVTWAHSRGYFLEALEAEVLRARRFNRGLSLVFFDLDEFGKFNQDFGHSTGDRLLRAVAMSLAAFVSPPEVVARYGGDEFVLLLPESNRVVAVQLTSQIIDRLADLSVFEDEAHEANGVSASAAIVSYPEDGGSREELLTAAEIALEQAKEERREMMTPQRKLTPVQQLRLAGRRHTA